MSKETWMWLASGLGWGAVNSGQLLAACPGGAPEVEQSLGSHHLDEVLTQKQAERLAASQPADFALRIRHMQAAGIAVLCFSDDEYPELLKNIHNPPLVLFVKGSTALLNGQLSVGIVGARRPSAYGVEAVKAIGRGVALGGAIIVSGLAAGLDAEAHKAALAVNGPTIACIAFGHEHCYPAANRPLMEVIQRNGAVISEYPTGTQPEKPYFLQRNRIIAGLSHALVVAEARRYSGTMSTVNFAIDYGRDVFAVPGSIFSELSGGTNAMIREGAYLAGNAGDILGVYGIQLKTEDPVSTVAKQAPPGALHQKSTALPWIQASSSFARADAKAAAQPLGERPGAANQAIAEGQTLGEMLRGHSKDQRGKASALQAIQAFKTLQAELNPGSESEMQARSQVLDELALAVSDTVDISRKALPKQAPKKGDAKVQAQPFPWHQVERLERDKVEKLSPAAPPEKARKPQRQSPATQQGLPYSTQPAPAVAPVGAIRPAGASAPVQPTSPPAAGATGTNSLQSSAAPVRRAAPRGQQSQPQAPPAQGSGLAGKLKTIKAGEPPKQAATAKGALYPENVLPPAAGLLSAEAEKARQYLGASPSTLAQICEKSGLSPAQAMAALTELELAGLSRQLAGRQFVIMQ